jgi:hypothetical protein
MVLAPGRSPLSSLAKDSSLSPSPFPAEGPSSVTGRGNSSSNPGRFSVSAFFGLRPLLISAIDQLQFPSLVYKMMDYIVYSKRRLLNAPNSCMI